MASGCRRFSRCCLKFTFNFKKIVTLFKQNSYDLVGRVLEQKPDLLGLVFGQFLYLVENVMYLLDHSFHPERVMNSSFDQVIKRHVQYVGHID